MRVCETREGRVVSNARYGYKIRSSYGFYYNDAGRIHVDIQNHMCLGVCESLRSRFTAGPVNHACEVWQFHSVHA